MHLILTAEGANPGIELAAGRADRGVTPEVRPQGEAKARRKGKEGAEESTREGTKLPRVV